MVTRFISAPEPRARIENDSLRSGRSLLPFDLFCCLAIRRFSGWVCLVSRSKVSNAIAWFAICMVWIVWLSGCAPTTATSKVDTPKSVQELLEEKGIDESVGRDISEDTTQSSSSESKPAEQSNVEPWLLDPVTVSHEPLPARTLLQLVTAPVPVTYTFPIELDGNPVITVPQLGGRCDSPRLPRQHLCSGELGLQCVQQRCRCFRNRNAFLPTESTTRNDDHGYVT